MRKHLPRIVTLLALVASLSVAVAPSVAGRKPPAGSAACSTPTLSGVVSADSYTVNGCGFAPGALVPVTVGEAGGCCRAFNLVADGSGAFTLTGSVWGSGTYRVLAAEPWHNGWRTAAEWSAEVA